MATAPGPGGSGPAAGTYTVPTTGSVSPREIYQLLLNAGFSTAQAIGIMANMIAESSLNPEAQATDSNGFTSSGLVQWNAASYPNSPSLVTGNPQSDVRAQVNYLAKTISKNAIAGSTPSVVAGNFAANFERCQGCQSGQSQYNARVANAALVQSWVTTGNWLTSGAGLTNAAPGSTGGNPSSTSTSASSSTCVLSAPSFFGFSLGGCLFSKTEARALVGGLMLAGGGLVMFGGLAVLALAAFGKTSAGKATVKAAGTTAEIAGAGLAVAGMPEAGAPLAAGGGFAKSRSKGTQARQYATSRRSQARARDRNDERRYDEVMARKSDSRKGPAVREPVPF
jgi:hypothetical protein